MTCMKSMWGKTWLIVASLLAVAFVVSAGCGGGGLVPVEGTVTLDGKPLKDVHVTFFPVDSDVNDSEFYRAVTDANGHFALLRPTDQRAGARPGAYRVTLSTAVAGPNDDETTPVPPERVPAKYRDPSHTIEVPAEGTTQADFKIVSR